MDNDFKVNIGKSGKLVKHFLNKEQYVEISETYSNAMIEDNWHALFRMADIFLKQQKGLAKNLSFKTNLPEAENAINYIKAIKNS